MTRGSSNGNVSGSSYDRRARKHYLLVTYESDEGPGTTRCYRCGRLLDFFTITVDRIKAGCHGGSYRRENIRPACGKCNSSTGGRLRKKKVRK